MVAMCHHIPRASLPRLNKDDWSSSTSRDSGQETLTDESQSELLLSDTDQSESRSELSDLSKSRSKLSDKSKSKLELPDQSYTKSEIPDQPKTRYELSYQPQWKPIRHDSYVEKSGQGHGIFLKDHFTGTAFNFQKGGYADRLITKGMNKEMNIDVGRLL